MSLFVPGLGLIYANRVGLGLAAMIGLPILLAVLLATVPPWAAGEAHWQAETVRGLLRTSQAQQDAARRDVEHIREGPDWRWGTARAEETYQHATETVEGHRSALETLTLKAQQQERIATLACVVFLLVVHLTHVNSVHRLVSEMQSVDTPAG